MKKCKYCGDDSGRIIKGLCMKHYMQQRLLGTVKKTKHDPNDYVEYEDYAEIILMDGKRQNETGRTIIDKEDLEKVLQHKWSLDTYGYVTSSKDRLRIHRFILNENDNSKVVDHINRNPLDNRKINLRSTTQYINTLNKDGLIGVGIRKRCNKYQARIKHKGKQITLGTFNTYEEALQARLKAEQELRPEI